MAKSLSNSIFFDTRAGSYWLQIDPARFLLLDKRDIVDHLAQDGMNVEEMIGPLKASRKCLLVARTERWVDYAGPLAGHAIGTLTTSDGSRALVTSAARRIEPGKADSECPFLDEFFGQLFGTADQTNAALFWLKCARESLAAGDFRPGQMLVLAGPSGCGKSLFQAFVTEFLGGRMAKPYRYMVGETAFNSDLAAAEHWCIEDEHGSTDIRTRRKFGTSLKEATVNRDLSVHAKGRQAITLPTFRRVTLSVNDEPENLMILPPLEPSILDKITLLRCAVANVGDNRLGTWTSILKELPAFVRMLSRRKIPDKLKSARYGVAAYHNPELVDQLHEISPEERLLSILDQELFTGKNRNQEFDGTAEELERRLRQSPFAFAIEKLLHFANACGVYLGRLSQRYPERFAPRKVRGQTTWTIKPRKV